MIETIITIIKAVWLVPFMILVIWYFKKSSTKGRVGEFVTNSVIRFSLDKDKYHLVKDLTIETPRGTSQIDEVVVSQFGIFVIETKSWSGWIYGSENQKDWTVIYKGGKKYRNRNPILQNRGHMKAFIEKFDVPEDKVFSIVVFVGDADRCEIKTKMPEYVGYASTMKKFINSKSEILFTENEVSTLLEDIERDRLPRSAETTAKHIKNLESRHGNKT